MGKVSTFTLGFLAGAYVAIRSNVRVLKTDPATVSALDVDSFDEMWDAATSLTEDGKPGFLDQLLSDLEDLGSSLLFEEGEDDG